MVFKNITNEDIEKIKILIRSRNSYKSIKEILDNLEVSYEELILKDLKELLHKGRSSITEFDVRDIINKYGNR